MLSPDPKDPQQQSLRRQAAAAFEAIEDVGDVHRAADGFSAALEYYESALLSVGVEHEFDPAVAARLTRKVAECHKQRGALDEALEQLARARNLLKGYEFELEYGLVLATQAEVLAAQGRFEEALRQTDVALEILRATAAHREFANLLALAAECQGRLGNADRYEQLNQDALATYRRIDDRAGVATVYNNLGLAYKNSCQWDKAIRALQQAVEISEDLGLTRRLARTLGNLGIVYTKTRDFDEAVSHLRRARRLARALGDVASQVSILNSMGNALLQAGRHELAEKYLLEAQVMAERHGLARSEALAAEFLGDLMQVRGRLDEARENYESGLKKARSFAPQGDVVGEIQRRLAELDLRSGLRSQAVAMARRALRTVTACGDLHEIGFIHRTLGRAARELGRIRQAEKSLIAGIDAFQSMRNPFEVAQTRTELASLYVETGGEAALRRAVREAQSAADTFRSLEEDRAYCRAALTLAQAHRGLGNQDDGILVLYDIERVCEECGDSALLAEARLLRKDLDNALVATSTSDVAQVNLFSELYSLTVRGTSSEAQVAVVLDTLCERVGATGAFLTLLYPAEAHPVVKAVHGLPASEAMAISRYIVDAGVEHRVWSQMHGRFPERFPSVAARAATVMFQPLRVEGRTLGVLYLERVAGDGVAPFGQAEVELVASYASLASVVLLEFFREQLQEPSTGSEALHPSLRRVITQDPSMIRVLRLAEKVARSNCTVLLSGETGTGKGLLAHCVHQMSQRRGKKFIALNCAALPEPLLESELFGHVRGAFTGAETHKIGLFEAAHGGTVFLDEVGKTSLFMQGKLLQFLDSSEVRPVGSNEFRTVDVRVICASKADLMQLVESGQFLEDLYYRLNDFPITIPPLRDRPGDVDLLLEHYLGRLREELHKETREVSRQALQLLREHAWPGNVRELEKTIKRAMILADDRGPITVSHLPEEMQRRWSDAESSGGAYHEGLSLREHLAEVEARIIQECLQRANGNKSEVARILGISYPSLLQKIKQHGQASPGGQSEPRRAEL